MNYKYLKQNLKEKKKKKKKTLALDNKSGFVFTTCSGKELSCSVFFVVFFKLNLVVFDGWK